MTNDDRAQPHPFDNLNSGRRYSPKKAIARIAENNGLCYCGAKDFLVRENQNTYPIFGLQFSPLEEDFSTCNIVTCMTCGRELEIAYELVFSSCVLKQGRIYDSDYQST